MSRLTAGDRFLIDQIQRGDADGWSQLVARYQGRLVAYARSRVGNQADAEDLVQETFLSFLRAMGQFRGQSSLETYLYSILRRRIADLFRASGGGKARVCSPQAAGAASPANEETPLAELKTSDPSASWYARLAEEHDRQFDVLDQAVWQLVEQLKETPNFRDLKVCELVFCAQMRNKDIAHLVEMDEKQVALVKHRFVKRLRGEIDDINTTSSAAPTDADPPEGLLTRVWEATRPSCPKRSTVGKWLLDTLAPDWHAYVQFHVATLGCHYCQANRDDLLEEQAGNAPQETRQRIFQSTVGFLPRD